MSASLRFSVHNLREGFDRIDLRIDDLAEVTDAQRDLIFEVLDRLIASFVNEPA
jgi:hypothetical protein